MQLRFVSWNIRGRRQREKQLDLLQTIAGDLIALQDVTVNAYHDLVESQLFAWSAFSLDLSPPFMTSKTIDWVLQFSVNLPLF